MKRFELPDSVKQLETEIDNACLGNQLLRCGREQALWWYLAFCEDILFRQLSSESEGLQRTACFTDYLVNTMKYPIRWIWSHCSCNGRLDREFNDDCYDWAWNLSKLAERYDPFETVYIYARAGYLQLDVVGAELVCSAWDEDVRYEAYDRLLGVESDVLSADPHGLFHAVANSVEVKGDRFRYGITPEFMAYARESMRPIEQVSSRLPRSWRLPDYTLGDFHDVTATIRCLAMIHHFARSIAAAKGCAALGIRDAVLLVKPHELVKHVAEYTSLPQSTVSAVVGDLRYGDAGVVNPDPALQPIVPLGLDRLAISPALWLSLDVERNFCVLANRLPHMKSAYSELSHDRSKILSNEIQRELRRLPVHFWTGSIPGRPDLPDIDFAIIDSLGRVCLILELKSFIEPAEPREIIERSEEIAKGVSQSRKLKEYHARCASHLEQLLDIEPGFRFYFAVASKNSVGLSIVQDDDVPVVRASHLVQQILDVGVSQACEWLESRRYLPIEGEHFDRVELTHEVADRTLRWYAIRPLVQYLHN